MVRDVTFLTCGVRPITICTASAGQSEQNVLVGRRGIVENDAFERRGIEELQYCTVFIIVF